MGSMPIVSVLLPAFNAERTIQRAVHSILDQTLTDLELVVVDDGSTDQTANLLKNIDDPRLRVIHTENRGVAFAANLGLKSCRCQWIARMDADDYAYSSRIERQLNWIKSHRLDAVGSQVKILDSTGQPVASMERYLRWINLETLATEAIHALRFVEYPLVNPTLLATRDFFEQGYADDQLPEDYDLFLRAAQQGLRFGKVPEVLLDWYEFDSGLTRTHPRYSREAFDHCRQKHLLLGPLNKISTVDLWGVGNTGKPWLNWLISQDIQVRHCYDVHPRKIGQRIRGRLIQHAQTLRRVDDTPLIVAVGKDGARDLILPFLNDHGYVPGQNAWFVA